MLRARRNDSMVARTASCGEVADGAVGHFDVRSCEPEVGSLNVVFIGTGTLGLTCVPLSRETYTEVGLSARYVEPSSRCGLDDCSGFRLGRRRSRGCPGVSCRTCRPSSNAPSIGPLTPGNELAYQPNYDRVADPLEAWRDEACEELKRRAHHPVNPAGVMVVPAHSIG